MKGSKIFIQLCKEFGLPEPIPEYKFHPTRKWRLDYYFERGGLKAALEVEGGVWTRGRHTRGKGFMKDAEKYNALAVHGIFLMRTVPSKLHSMETINLLLDFFKQMEAVDTNKN